jgi:hypothetical protein
MVWLVVGLPALAIVMGTSYAVIAFRVFDGVVVDDYDRRGRAINRVLARDRAAESRGLEGDIAIDPESGELTMAIRTRAAADLPPKLRLRFLHATRAGVDREIDLARGGDGRWRGRVAPLAAGRYHVQLETEVWRLVGQLRAPAELACALVPAT